MSDQRLRHAERRFMETRDLNDRSVWEAEHIRAGLGKLPRLVIRHYIAVEHHGVCGADGKIGIKLDQGGGWPYHSDKIRALCNAELWPRDQAQTLRGHKSTMKVVYYTEIPDEVTCKTCLRSISKPAVRPRRRVHYAPGSRNSTSPVPVCGRDDSAKFTERFIWDLRHTITCPACRRIMQRGVRAARRPRQVVPGPLDGLDGGRFPVGAS